MFNIVYLIWFLLPLAFFILWIWSLAKPYLKIPGREHTGNYFMQGVFCVVGLIISIVIDRTEVFENLLESFSYEKLDLRIARWLLYPVVLVVLSFIQQFVAKARKKETKRPQVLKRY